MVAKSQQGKVGHSTVEESQKLSEHDEFPLGDLLFRLVRQAHMATKSLKILENVTIGLVMGFLISRFSQEES